VFILKEIRHLHITLHEGTYSAPTGFSTSTVLGDDVAWNPSSYSLCIVAGHTSELPSHIHASPVPFPSIPDLDPDLAHVSRFTGHNVLRLPVSNRGVTNRLPAGRSFSDVPSAPRLSTSVATSRRLMSLENQPLSITSLESAAADATQGDPDISNGSPTHTIPRLISRDSPASPRSEKWTIIPSPVVSDSAPPPIPMSTVSPTSTVNPLNSESPHSQSEDIPRAPGSPSSSPPLAHLQLVSDLDSQASVTQHDIRDVDPSAPIEAFRHSGSSAGEDPGVSESISRLEGYRRDSTRSWLRVTNVP
jgi:hypothetical protein